MSERRHTKHLFKMNQPELELPGAPSAIEIMGDAYEVKAFEVQRPIADDLWPEVDGIAGDCELLRVMRKLCSVQTKNKHIIAATLHSAELNQ